MLPRNREVIDLKNVSRQAARLCVGLARKKIAFLRKSPPAQSSRTRSPENYTLLSGRVVVICVGRRAATCSGCNPTKIALEMSLVHSKTNVTRLSIAQALAGANTTVVYATGAVIGDVLAPHPSLSTLPISVFVVGMAYPPENPRY